MTAIIILTPIAAAIYITLATIGYYIDITSPCPFDFVPQEKHDEDEQPMEPEQAIKTSIWKLGFILKPALAKHYIAISLAYPMNLYRWYKRRKLQAYVLKEPGFIPKPLKEPLVNYLVDDIPEIPLVLKPLLRADARRLGKQLEAARKEWETRN